MKGFVKGSAERFAKAGSSGTKSAKTRKRTLPLKGSINRKGSTDRVLYCRSAGSFFKSKKPSS